MSDSIKLRLELLANGFEPVPLTGKACVLPGWRTIAVTPDVVREWATGRQRTNLNTGIRTGTLLGLDIDVPAAGLAAEIEALADTHLGPTLLIRIGQAPKSLRLYRRNAAARKRATPALYLPDGTKTQVEALGDGQQFAAFGIHPDTGRPYDWPNCSPIEAPLDSVPLVTETAVAEFLAAAEALLRAAGGRTKQEIDGAARKADRQTSGQDATGFFRQVNRAALDNPAAWVLRLFPTAEIQAGTGAYRVHSADLGRDLEEDLSIHTDGIQDFGTERSMSPCDVVMEFGGAPTVQAAALLLCEWMGREPTELGWKPQTTGGREFANWQDGLQRERGLTVSNLANAAHALRLAPELAGILAHDEMLRKTLVTRSLPGSRMAAISEPRPLEGTDVGAIQEWLQRHDLRRVSQDTVRQAVALVAMEHAFHPVQDYLSGLSWDGTPRIDTWLSSYLGAEATPYTRAIGRMFLIAMVARIMRPGCKCDYMLILEGSQGLNKSTVCEILGGQYFSDGLPDLHRGDAVRVSMHLRGKWVIEIAELSSFNKAEADDLKAFVTKRAETYTPKHAHNEVTEPRQCVFIGTTNESVYLQDATGGRRFWPVSVTKVDAEALGADRDQLFAEAMAAFLAGHPWWPDREFEAEHITPVQELRRETDEWEGIIAAWLAAPGAEFGGSDPAPLVRTTVAAVAQHALRLPADKLGTREQRRITKALRRLGWADKRDMHGRWWEAGQ